LDTFSELMFLRPPSGDEPPERIISHAASDFFRKTPCPERPVRRVELWFTLRVVEAATAFSSSGRAGLLRPDGRHSLVDTLQRASSRARVFALDVEGGAFPLVMRKTVDFPLVVDSECAGVGRGM